ncbi:MAG: sigma-70 family RNA polymerase sigma factor [Peptococcaceae bacterium]|jgi:DNA-directed RNA polymerase specialized sigma subunit|nr:sigma-70 family RNA polymerase sigma factor [Peptococcaceae bacterium]
MTESAFVKSVLQQASKKDAIEQLDKVNLTKRERIVAEYIYFDGLTTEKVAEVLDVSTSSVAKWKKDIVKKCSKVFGMCV